MDGEGAGPAGHGWQFSPIVIGLLGVIAGFMMVATYHCISLGFCCCCCNNSQQAQNNESNTRQDTERNNDHRQEWQRDRIRTSSVMRVLMPVFRYSRKDCNEEDTCAVCLGDFKEGEQVRVLPECLHLFHVPCIDMWLSSHSNCPLCRAHASAVPPPHLVLTLPDSGGAPPPEFLRVSDYRV